MYADRYGPRPVNRASLTLSVGIVGGLVAAAMLSPTVVRIVKHERDLDTYIVPPPAPPPPPTLETKVEPKAEVRPTQIEPPITIVPTPAPDNFHVATPDPGPPPDLSALEGSGTGIIVDPPKPPPPVLTTARPDPRVDFQPSYPAEERRAGNEGMVTLRVLIGVDGRVRQVEKIAAASDAFWRVTQERALAKWRFTPATRDGVPYESWRTMNVRFRLEAE